MKSKIMKMMVTLFALTSISAVAGTTVKDAEGNKYPTVKIGQQIWMAKNLNVNVPGSMCYENDPANCEKYGRLYTWKAAKQVCPSGWRLPSKEEFETLLAVIGTSVEEQSGNLRASSWGNGADKYGFSALPAGYYYSYDQMFGNLGSYSYFWSSMEDDSDYAYNMYVSGSRADVSSSEKDLGNSVRCLQGSNEGSEASLFRSEAQPSIKTAGDLTDTRDGKTYRTVKIGDQIWMAKNLNVNVSGSRCYDNDPANCEKYGRLYTWESAKRACPAGWHLPSSKEFETLLATILLSRTEPYAKEQSENLRASSWENGENKFGFSALPAGFHYGYGPSFNGLGRNAGFWSSTENVIRAFYLEIVGGYALLHNDGVIRNTGYSVRCLRD